MGMSAKLRSRKAEAEPGEGGRLASNIFPGPLFPWIIHSAPDSTLLEMRPYLPNSLAVNFACASSGMPFTDTSE